MEDKLNKIFKFLKENRQYNQELQEKCYISDILPYEKISDKVLALLYRVVNTQAGPQMDSLAPTFRIFQEDPKCLESFDSFVEHISKEKYKKKNHKKKDDNKIKGKYDSLYVAMNDLPGWGPKTAALFVKSIYHLHNGNYGSNNDLKVWDDAPENIVNGDVFRLPVDAVMESIFKKINPFEKKLGFEGANKKLLEMGYSAEEIEVWDDLWFWGYITQIGGGGDRKFGWNENKYWSQRDTSKEEQTILEIKTKAEEFLAIL